MSRLSAVRSVLLAHGGVVTENEIADATGWRDPTQGAKSKLSVPRREITNILAHLVFCGLARRTSAGWQALDIHGEPIEKRKTLKVTPSRGSYTRDELNGAVGLECRTQAPKPAKVARFRSPKPFELSADEKAAAVAEMRKTGNIHSLSSLLKRCDKTIKANRMRDPEFDAAIVEAQTKFRREKERALIASVRDLVAQGFGVKEVSDRLKCCEKSARKYVGMVTQ